MWGDDLLGVDVPRTLLALLFCFFSLFFFFPAWYTSAARRVRECFVSTLCRCLAGCTMWYQFWQPPQRAVRAVLALWRCWLAIFVLVTILAATDTGLTLVSDIDFPIPYLKTLAPLRVNVPLPVWTMVAALLTTGVFLWMGFSRGLPHHLRVFGKFEDPNPWTYDSDAAAFAEELVSTAGEVDDGTGVEIVRVTGNIIEPGEPGALFFRRGVINIWDRFYDQLCVQRHKRRAAMLGNAGTGKSYSLMYLLRRALMDNRVVVVELRKTEVVYLFEPSGVPPPSEQDDDRAWSKFKCRAWVVTLRDWRDANCAALCVQDNVYLIDPNEAGKPPLHRPRAARAFVAASLNPDHVKEWLKDGGVSRAVGVATLAEMQVVGRTLRQWSPEKVLRRFLVCGGRIRALLADDTPTRMATLVTTLAHETLWNITLYGQVNPGLDGKYEASSALVATVPEPNGIETKLAAVSPYALQLLTMYHRDLILKHTGTAPTPGAAGRIYEQYFQLSFALGGNFRVRQLVADDDNTITAEQVVTLPRSLIVPLRTGPTQAAGFVEQWAQLPTTAQLDTAANPGAVPLGRAADPKQHFLQSIGQLPQADRRAALPNFDIDLAAVVDIATATADDASDDGDDRDGGDDDGDGATHCLLVPDVPLDNVPIVDAADARDRAFQVTRTPLHRRKKMGLRQLEQYLNATGATTARPLKLYYFVTTAAQLGVQVCVNGCVVMGVPVGTDAFVEQKMEAMVDAHIGELEAVKYFSKQLQWTLLRLCFNQRVTHLLRVLPLHLGEAALGRFDMAITEKVLTIIVCAAS